MFDKNVIILSLQAALINKLDIQKNILASIINDRNSETKSSAGDKFETNREMIHIEISKIELEIFKTEQFINETRTGRSQLIITNNGTIHVFGKGFNDFIMSRNHFTFNTVYVQ
mgnify:CR=1 FL=1